MPFIWLNIWQIQQDFPDKKKGISQGTGEKFKNSKSFQEIPGVVRTASKYIAAKAVGLVKNSDSKINICSQGSIHL